MPHFSTTGLNPDGAITTYTLACREPNSLITVGRCGDDAASFTTGLFTKISAVGPCILDEARLDALIAALTKFRDQIHDANVREAAAKVAERRRIDSLLGKDQTITDHSYLSAGDNPRASGDRAYRGCSREINGSICNRSRKEHQKG